MTGLPEGFEPDVDCDCEWCSAWRKKEKSEAKRKEKIDPDVAHYFKSVYADEHGLYVEKSIYGDGVYIRVGAPCTGQVFSFEDTRLLAKILKAMSK